MGYSEWEAAKNGTQSAIDLIPKDIIVCDWHYGKQTNYASVPFLLGKGFRVWPPVGSPWTPPKRSARLLSKRASSHARLPVHHLGKGFHSANRDWPPCPGYP